jgi:hypothetical protein
LELDEGPNWWFQGISTGGMHPVVVPFHNFGVFGVLGALVFTGALLGWVDSRGERYLWPRLVYAGFLTFSFQWFWYGDMNFVRGLMAIGLVGAVYQTAKIVSRPRPDGSAEESAAAERLLAVRRGAAETTGRREHS